MLLFKYLRMYIIHLFEYMTVYDSRDGWIFLSSAAAHTTRFGLVARTPVFLITAANLMDKALVSWWLSCKSTLSSYDKWNFFLFDPPSSCLRNLLVPLQHLIPDIFCKVSLS